MNPSEDDLTVGEIFDSFSEQEKKLLHKFANGCLPTTQKEAQLWHSMSEIKKDVFVYILIEVFKQSIMEDKMNHEDMTYTEAKDILKNYIHTEFFERKDSDVGQAIVKSIILLSKESEKEIKYSGKGLYNYYNAPKRFCPCPVCGYNRRRFSWGSRTDTTDKQNYKCQKCDFTMIIEFPKFAGISNAMVRTCWNKVCKLYYNKHRNGHTVIPWVTYGNTNYPLRLEVLYFENKGEHHE